MQVRRLLTTINPKTRGQGRNRTAVRGFADPYLAARPPDPKQLRSSKDTTAMSSENKKKTLVYQINRLLTNLLAQQPCGRGKNMCIKKAAGLAANCYQFLLQACNLRAW
jgi:hypothetical protein